jgi:hypothetical protein
MQFRTGLKTVTDQENFFRELTEFAKARRLQNPDYRKSLRYSPQWKVIGNVHYYQFPSRKGPVIAVRYPGADTFGTWHFKADGITTELKTA